MCWNMYWNEKGQETRGLSLWPSHLHVNGLKGSTHCITQHGIHTSINVQELFLMSDEYWCGVWVLTLSTSGNMKNKNPTTHRHWLNKTVCMIHTFIVLIPDEWLARSIPLCHLALPLSLHFCPFSPSVTKTIVVFTPQLKSWALSAT